MSMNVLDFLEEAVKRNPDKTAVLDNKRSYSYRQLSEMAKTVAMVFTGSRRKPIIVLCKRDVRCIIAFWGVLYSGNFYVPLDEGIPQQRMDEIVENTQAEVIVVLEGNEKIQKYCDDKNIKLVCFENIIEEKKTDEIILNSIRKKMTDVDPIYMVYTSGSTGRPKGVIKSQRSVISFLEAFEQVFDFEKQDVFGNQASFDFDVAAKDIFLSVYKGATVAVIPKMCFMIPKEMIVFLNQNKISILIWAAAAVRYVANSGILRKEKPEYLRKVFFSGEVLQKNELKKWKDCLSDVQYVNLYAPTEVTGNCMYYMARELAKIEQLPLGQAFPNIEILVLKEDGQEASEGETGEIYIRGAFLAQGYYNDFSKTAESFVQNPRHSRYPDVVYKTGDLVRIDNGELYYIGRIDNQIKHMGHRIELSEIEQTLYNKTDKVKRCCAIFDKEENKIVLVLQGEQMENNQVQKLLSEFLPKYMIPHEYIWFEKIAENARGKLDRQAVIDEYLQRKRSEK